MMIMKNQTLSAISILMVGCTLVACSPETPMVSDGGYVKPNAESSKYQTKVIEYMPAPGQFINEDNQYFATAEEANAEALKTLKNGNYVSLGGFGGYIVVGFDHSIASGAGYDFFIKGNPFHNSSEPGIIYVMQDANGNRMPDDMWYELKGSNYNAPSTVRDYEVTYHKPTTKFSNVKWTDNKGGKGEIEYLQSFHNQDTYFPSWVTTSTYKLKGTRLETKVVFNETSKEYEMQDFEWGYVDNFGSDYITGQYLNGFKISNAVDIKGNAVKLEYIDFIKVQAAVNATAGHLGEVSTEVVSFVDARL